MVRAWDDLVAEGRKIIQEMDQRQWRLGDLAVEVVGKANGIHDHEGRAGRLREFADAIGCPYDQLRKYRAVSAAWKCAARHNSVAWSLHRDIYTLPDHERVMTEYLAHCREHGNRVGEGSLQAYLGRRRAERVVTVRETRQTAEPKLAARFFRVLDSDQRARLREGVVRPGRGERDPQDEQLFVLTEARLAKQKLVNIASVLAKSPTVRDDDEYQQIIRDWLIEIHDVLSVIQNAISGGESIGDAIDRILREGK